jgi:hypothetical protein
MDSPTFLKVIRPLWVLSPSFALCLALGQAHAQIVTGTTRDRATRTELAGVLVTLLGPSGAELRSVLSDERGRFSIRAPGAGAYRVSAKRIGVRRTLTDPIVLLEREMKIVDLDMEALTSTLPEVTVATTMFCMTNPEEAGRIAQLWAEVLTALSSTSISTRDSLYEVQIDRYVRDMDPRTMRVLRESRESHRGRVSVPFSSVDPESLSIWGYWRERGDTVTFFGVDLDVLQSDPFRRDHCLGLARVREDRPGQVGLTFEPAPERRLPDIRGTIWLDASSFQLTRLEYQYTRLPRLQYVERSGGELEFRRLPSGAWIVSDWKIRMPQVTRYVQRSSGRSLGMAPSQTLTPPTIHRIVETGGAVTVEGAMIMHRSAAIEGVVLDSLGQPLRVGLVTLAGSDFGAQVDSAGHFRLTSLPAGAYDVYLVDSMTNRLGVPAAVTAVNLRPQTIERIILRVDRAASLMSRMCGGKTVADGRFALRVTVVDSATDTAQRDTPLRVSWTEYSESDGIPSVVIQRLQSVTGSDGSAVFCGLPVAAPLDVERVINDETGQPILTLRNPAAAPTSIQVRVHARTSR